MYSVLYICTRVTHGQHFFRLQLLYACTLHRSNRADLTFPMTHRTPAAENNKSSFCSSTSFHGTTHLPARTGNDCRHDSESLRSTVTRCTGNVQFMVNAPRVSKAFETKFVWEGRSHCRPPRQMSSLSKSVHRRGAFARYTPILQFYPSLQY